MTTDPQNRRAQVNEKFLELLVPTGGAPLEGAGGGAAEGLTGVPLRHLAAVGAWGVGVYHKGGGSGSMTFMQWTP